MGRYLEQFSPLRVCNFTLNKCGRMGKSDVYLEEHYPWVKITHDFNYLVPLLYDATAA